MTGVSVVTLDVLKSDQRASLGASITSVLHYGGEADWKGHRRRSTVASAPNLVAGAVYLVFLTYREKAGELILFPPDAFRMDRGRVEENLSKPLWGREIVGRVPAVATIMVREAVNEALRPKQIR
jgi:hypothetical protein